MKSLYYWLTHNTATGEQYHTVWHCIMKDLWTLIPIILFCAIIIRYYLGIGWNANKQYSQNKESELLAFFKYKFLVFSFCAIAGYFMLIVRVWFPVYKLLIPILSVLAYYSHGLYYQLKDSDLIKKHLELERNYKLINEKAAILENKNKEFEKAIIKAKEEHDFTLIDEKIKLLLS